MRFLIAFSFLITSFYSYSKDENVVYTFQAKADSLVQLSDTMQFASTMSKVLANQNFERILREILDDPTSIKYDFSKVTCLSVLDSPRKKTKFRIYTWVLKTGNDSYDYYGYTQYQRNRKKKKKVQNFVYTLTDKRTEIGRDENSKLDSNRWLGCVYYQIIPPGKRKDKTFLLIGWDGNNWRSTKKIIETFSFNNKGEITFGKPVIKYNVGTIKKPKMVTKSRLIFEYNAKISMTASYNVHLKQVIFDHLSPSNPNLASLYFTYAPDFTYDGLKYSKKKWIHTQDVDVRNQELVDPVKWKPEDAKNRTADTLIPQR